MNTKFIKYFHIIALSILFLFCVLFEFRHFNKYKVLKVISPCELYLDLNKNNQIDDDELVIISGVREFELNKENKDFSNEEKIFLNYKFKKWAKSELLNKYVKLLKNNDEQYIFLKGKNYTYVILEKGLAYFFSDKYENYFNTENAKSICKEIKDLDLVLLNNKTKKYHKLDCDLGNKSQNYDIVSLKLLGSEHKKCQKCFGSQKEEPIKKYYPKFESYKQSGNLEIFFIDFFNTKRPNSNCDNPACKRLLSEINNSQSSIDFAIYGISNQPQIFNALVNAYKRGVNVRWISDVDSKGDTYYQDNHKLKTIITTFKSDNDCSSRYLMHNKFFIFDNQKVWTGSSNITDTDFSSFNANYNVLINSAEIASIYKQEFEQMYFGKFHTAKTSNVSMLTVNNIKILFSPQDSIITKELIPLINNAKNYIYIPIFYLTHKNLAQALIDAKQRGVDIKLIIDATNASGKYTVHHQLRQAGIKVKVENYAGKMHMKTIIVDDKYVALGSMNLTKSGEEYNDENVVIIQDSIAAQFFKSTFLTLWNAIPDVYLSRDPKAESLASIGSCFDGIDNDFDGKIDSLDEGCFPKH